MDKYYQVALAAVKQAAVVFKKNFGCPKTVSIKGGNYRNLLTEVDGKIEKMIRQKIHQHFPNHKIIGEELGWKKNGKNDMVWIIDPIDGTTNFSRGIPLCCISLALWDKDSPRLGIIYNPITNQLYSAQKGKGAKLNGKKIKVSKISKFADSIGGISWSLNLEAASKMFPKIIKSSRKNRALGSAAYQLCLVAEGAYDHLIINDAHIWDIAAGMLIITEAGGKISDWEGKRPDYKIRNLIASNGKIHNEILKKLR
ncbi:MAG: inositol monophosphatase [Candidatus Doudnabacteria bacterium]|nr:inositol monophosphatase [Candidatus Doudnabacteria bacterium]